MDAITPGEFDRAAAGTITGRWTFVCFGAFAIDSGAGPQLPPLGKKARALLAWLAVNNVRVARERLIGLLWSRRGEEQARQSLRQALTEIRHFARAAGLPSPIDGDRDHLFIATGRVLTDIALLRQRAADGDLGGIAEQLGDCPCQLLDDLDGVDPAYDDWLAMERPRQHDARIAAALAAAQRARTAGQHGPVSLLLTVLRAHDAAHQGIAHAAMEAAFAAGDRDTMRHVLRQHEIAVSRDLDCPIAPETRLLFNRLMASPLPAPAAESPARLPGGWIV